MSAQVKLKRVGQGAYQTGRFHVERLRSGRWWVTVSRRASYARSFRTLSEARSYIALARSTEAA